MSLEDCRHLVNTIMHIAQRVQMFHVIHIEDRKFKSIDCKACVREILARMTWLVDDSVPFHRDAFILDMCRIWMSCESGLPLASASPSLADPSDKFRTQGVAERIMPCKGNPFLSWLFSCMRVEVSQSSIFVFSPPMSVGPIVKPVCDGEAGASASMDAEPVRVKVMDDRLIAYSFQVPVEERGGWFEFTPISIKNGGHAATSESAPSLYDFTSGSHSKEVSCVFTRRLCEAGSRSVYVTILRQLIPSNVAVGIGGTSDHAFRQYSIRCSIPLSFSLTNSS